MIIIFNEISKFIYSKRLSNGNIVRIKEKFTNYFFIFCYSYSFTSEYVFCRNKSGNSSVLFRI